jgi:hypothetical protein
MNKIVRPRPDRWRHSDPFEHIRYIPFLRARAQATFRQEEFLLTFEDWCYFWSTEELWHRRGRASTALTLMRCDPLKPWSRDNCCLMERYYQILIANRRKHNLPYEEYFAEALNV